MVRIHTHWSNKIRPRLHNEYLSIPSPTKWDHFSLSFLSSVRFFVTRARRDPSTSSRPPRSDARVVSEIRGQIFDCLRFPSFSEVRSSIVFDRPRAPPVDEGCFFYFFYRTRTIFPLSRAREVYSIEDEGSTRAPRLAVSHAGETPIRYPASRERRERASATTSRRETPTRDAEDSSTCIHAYVHRAIARRARAARSSSDRSTVGQHARSRGRDSTRIGRRARG